MIRFDGYTTDEKVAIARGHLWPRQVERNGLRAGRSRRSTDAVLRLVVTDYTREAGVRQLERELGHAAAEDGDADRVGRPDDAGRRSIAAAVRDALGRPKFFHEAAVRTAVPGVATGLAVTGVGGDVLFVEAASMPGKGGLVLTGQLGDVMKESARIALTYVKSHAAELGIDERALDGRELHVHVPAGAIPKDGPSAGITMVTAIASLLTGRPVKSTVGMTGEVTLQGRVLPIGGLKQKVLAAHAAGLTEVIVPERNEPDLDDVPADVRDQMRFHLVGSVDQVLALALEPGRARAGGVDRALTRRDQRQGASDVAALSVVRRRMILPPMLAARFCCWTRALVIFPLAAGLAMARRDLAAAPGDLKVTPGEFVVEHPTLINLGFEWHIDGDANRNASVDVSFRKQGETAWQQGHAAGCGSTASRSTSGTCSTS